MVGCDGAGGPREGRQTQLLRRAFKDNFQVIEQAPRQREAQPPGSLQNPHEPDAQWAAKGEGKPKKVHIGYKVQAAETVQDQPVAKGEPTRSFLTAVLTQPAIASEDAYARRRRIRREVTDPFTASFYL